MRISVLWRSSAIMALLGAGVPAWAAEKSIELASAEAELGRSDIIVTGVVIDEGQNKTAANGALGNKTLLDTPYSVTVVDIADISKRQAKTIGQIFINDPSIFSFATKSTTNWWGTQIRGLGVRNYYIDDVPLLLYWGGDFPLEGIQSVEALKGLTGFMYGFGAPGGAISYRTKRPTADAQLSTEIGYATNSNFYAHLDAGGPLSKDGKLGYRLNIAGEKGTAYNEAGVNRWLASLALEYAFNSDLKWYVTATYEHSDLKHEPFQLYWDEYADSKLPKVTYDYDKLNVDNSFYKTRTLAAATGLDWQFAPKWSANFKYGYTSKLHRSNKMFAYMLNRAGDYEGFAYNFAEQHKNHFVQAMVQGEFETGPIRHAIVAGTSYMANDVFFGLNDYYWSNDFSGNIYQDQTFRVTRNIRFGTDGAPYKERQRALFLSDTLYFGDHLQAMLGARYTRYKLVDTDGDPTIATGYRTSKLSPSAALIYKPVPHVSIYGSYVEAMEPGTRVDDPKYENNHDILKTSVSKQYEAGVKYQHQGLSLTGAVFQIERANTIEQEVNGLLYLTQDGLSVYKGIEGIAAYRVNEDLKLGAGAVYLDGKIRDVSQGAEYLEGHTPQQVAKWQVTANFEYYVAAVKGLSLHGDVRYFGKAPTTDDNVLYIPSRTIANVGFEYETQIAARKVTFTGNVNNLFNKKYWDQGNVGEGVNGSFGVRIDW